MIISIFLCNKNGIITKAVGGIPICPLREGQDIRLLFEAEEKLDLLLKQELGCGVSSRLSIKLEGTPSVCVTVKEINGQLLFMLYQMEDFSQLPQFVELLLAALNLPEIAGLESYGSGYYEIQKLNSQLINSQRTLAKANVRLQNLLEETRKAQCTIDALERDTLTGLLREKIFYEKAGDVLHKNPNLEFDILAVDIEQFKIVNAAFGSAKGDRLLMDLSLCLLTIQQDDLTLITRARADTFFALLPRRRSLYDTLDKNISFFLEDYPLPMRIQVKIGIYQIDDRNLSIARMCDRALLAVNSIKGNFSRKFAFYNCSMHEKLMLEQKIINTMVESLKREEFLVYLQPKVEIATKRVIGAEALIRWNHPEFGMVPPNDFIPIFERNRFIYPVDLFVWEKSCKMLQTWKNRGIKNIHISVNVSRTDLYHEGITDTLSELVHRYGLEPSELHLEITESAYVKNAVQLLVVIRQLKQAGFIIEMDDFGSGYSSLNTLAELPIDVMKLDLKFLKQTEHEMRKQKVVKTAIILAKELDLKIIAEGVETEEQAALLKTMGCHYAQGYLYGRPMPEQEFCRLLLSQT